METPGGVRVYDQDEANRALPTVRRLVQQIVELSQQLPELQDQCRIAEYRMNRDGAVRADADRFEQAAKSVRAAEDALLAAVEDLGVMGVVLKDPQIGLIDFYAYRDGEMVELCWKLGEDSVGHWHRIGEGFRGRRPL